MIELRAGQLRCELEPEQGGAIAGLWRDAMELLRPGRAGACLPLVPYSNRVGQAAVVWQGTQQPQVRHPGDAPEAIHGIAWQRPWTVLEADESSAMLAFEHRPDASWPFAFDCSHTLRLRPSGLELTLALTNQSAQPAPAGLGWRVRLPLRTGSRVALRAAARWDMDADHLPIAQQADAGLDADGAGLDLERCYEGWDGLLRLRDPTMSLRLRSGLSRLVVWSRAGEDSLVAEPVSHVPNAVHLYAAGAATTELGLHLLQPGESLLAEMAIELEGAG